GGEVPGRHREERYDADDAERGEQRSSARFADHLLAPGISLVRARRLGVCSVMLRTERTNFLPGWSTTGTRWLASAGAGSPAASGESWVARATRLICTERMFAGWAV